MRASSPSLPTPEGPLSVSGAPNLPAGFTDTFTSRFIDVGDTGEVRVHAVIGGDGPPLLLIHGWPGTSRSSRSTSAASGSPTSRRPGTTRAYLLNPAGLGV